MSQESSSNTLDLVLEKFDDTGATKALEKALDISYGEQLKSLGKSVENFVKQITSKKDNDDTEHTGSNEETLNNSENKVEQITTPDIPDVKESLASRRHDVIYEVTAPIDKAIEPEHKSTFGRLRLGARGANLSLSTKKGEDKYSLLANPLDKTVGLKWNNGNSSVELSEKLSNGKTKLNVNSGTSYTKVSASIWTQGSKNYGANFSYSQQLNMNTNINFNVSANKEEGVAASTSLTKIDRNANISIGAFGGYCNGESIVGIKGRIILK